MPADSPQAGEIWRLPNQPTLTTSGEGGEALVVGIQSEVVTLYSRRGRRIILPQRSFLLMWQFVRALGEPSHCSTIPCMNHAWFEYNGHGDNANLDSRPVPVCWAHIPTDFIVNFLEQGTATQGQCPACLAGSRSNGGGSSEVRGLRINSCGQCRRDWVWFSPTQSTPEVCVLLAEQCSAAAEILEERGFVARIRVGAGAFDMIRKAVGALGEPPHLHGIQIARLPTLTASTNTTYVIGYQPREVHRGVQRLGGQPDQGPDIPAKAETFTNSPKPGPLRAAPEALVPGASWWNKASYEAAFIVEVGVKMSTSEVCIKFRDSGIPEILTLDAFLAQYTDRPPEPPCAVGEEWEDTRGRMVTVKATEETAAKVEDTQGSAYLLPYVQFHQWRKVIRKSIYDRLVDDSDDSV